MNVGLLIILLISGIISMEKLNIVIMGFILIHMMSKFVEEQCIGILKILIVMEGLFMKDDL